MEIILNFALGALIGVALSELLDGKKDLVSQRPKVRDPGRITEWLYRREFRQLNQPYRIIDGYAHPYRWDEHEVWKDKGTGGWPGPWSEPVSMWLSWLSLCLMTSAFLAGLGVVWLWVGDSL